MFRGGGGGDEAAPDGAADEDVMTTPADMSLPLADRHNHNRQFARWELEQLKRRCAALERRSLAVADTVSNSSGASAPPPQGRRASLEDGPLEPVAAAASLCAHAANGHNAEVVMLLGLGVPPSVTDDDGRTPLHLAAMNGRVDICRLLLEAGANCVARDAHGHTPVMSALLSPHLKATQEVCALLAETYREMCAQPSDGTHSPTVSTPGGSSLPAQTPVTPALTTAGTQCQMGDMGDAEARHLPQPREQLLTSGHCRFSEPKRVLPTPLSWPQSPRERTVATSATSQDDVLSPTRRQRQSSAGADASCWAVGAVVTMPIPGGPDGQMFRGTVVDLADGFVTIRFEDEQIGEQQIPVAAWDGAVFDDQRADWRPPLKDTTHWHSDENGLILVMVGLPGRGKTFIARRLCRWLNWMGIRSAIFNVGKYRREVTKKAAEHASKFFDPSNAGAVLERERLAAMACHDLAEFMLEHPSSVGILDATNSTEDRRANLLRTFGEVLPPHRIIFVESVCTDSGIIEANILRAKLGNDDYKGRDAEFVLSDFKERIQQYEKVYEPLREETDDGRSWIQLRNVSGAHNRGGQIRVNRVSGTLPQKLLFFLLNLHTTAVPVYLCRAGECTDQVLGKLGGNSNLTHKGWLFAAELRRFFNHPDHRHPKMHVLTSTMRRAVRTARWFGHGQDAQDRFALHQYRCLNDLDLGECEGLTLQQVQELWPQTWQKRRADKYNYGWPRGESYRDLNLRLEQVILDLHKAEVPYLIIAHLDVCRGLYSYLAELLPESCVDIDIPLHQVVEFKYAKHELQVQVHDLSGFVSDDKTLPVGKEEEAVWLSGYHEDVPTVTPPHCKLADTASVTGGGDSGAGAAPTQAAPQGVTQAASKTGVWDQVSAAVHTSRVRLSPQLASMPPPAAGTPPFPPTLSSLGHPRVHDCSRSAGSGSPQQGRHFGVSPHDAAVAAAGGQCAARPATQGQPGGAPESSSPTPQPPAQQLPQQRRSAPVPIAKRGESSNPASPDFSALGGLSL